jgi:complex III assembly factor LYRM7
MASRSRVLSGYRRLFRARKNVFLGDDKAMRESRVAIKSEFVKNKAEVTPGTHFEGLLTMIDEAEDMLRHGLVRGNLNKNTGHYGR